MQKFSTQASEKRWYEVVRWNEVSQEWEPISAEIYPTEELAKKRAEELNKDYLEDLRQFNG